MTELPARLVAALADLYRTQKITVVMHWFDQLRAAPKGGRK
jgi:hypothetical protein